MPSITVDQNNAFVGFNGANGSVYRPLGDGRNGLNLFPVPQYSNPASSPASTPSGTVGIGGVLFDRATGKPVSQPTTPAGPAAGQGTGAPTRQPGGQPYSSSAGNYLASIIPGSSNYLTSIAQGQFPAHLTQSGEDTSFLRQIAQNNGNPYDATPAWTAMVGANERNVQKRAADLNEFFNVQGGRFSTDFGSGMADFYNQASRDENSLLAQMQLASHESAQGRNLNASTALASNDLALRRDLLGMSTTAAGMLGQQGFQAASMLSGQDFQDYLNRFNTSFQAGQQGANIAAQAAALLHQGGVTGAQNLHNTAVGAGTSVYQTQNAGASSLFQNQNTQLQSYVSSALQSRGMDATMANSLAGLLLSNTQTGGALGAGQYGINQQEIDRMYQEWMRTQPAYNPLLPYMFQAGTTQSPYYYPGYQPSQIPGYLQAGASIGQFLKMILGGS